MPVISRTTIFILLAAMGFLENSFAQLTYTWNGSVTNNEWGNATNWLVGNTTASEFPNGNGTNVIFVHNSNANLVVNVDNTDITAGGFNVSGNRSVFLGNFTANSGNLTLNTGNASSPVISVSLSGGYDFQIRTELLGESGFTKNGTGTMFSRQINHSGLNGTITIQQGELVIGQGGSLGNAANAVDFTGNATLTSCPSTLESDTVVHSASRTFSVLSGLTGNFTNLVRTAEGSSANRSLTTAIEGNLTGNGSFSFAKKSINAGGESYFLLNGTNTYTGTTSIQDQAIVILGAGSNISEGALVIALAGGKLDLGGNNQTISNLSTALGSTNSNATITNGSLLISGSEDVVLGGANSGAQIDLTGLSSFSRNSTSGNFSIRTGTQLSNTNTISLSRNGSNLIAAEMITVGGANQSSATTRTTNLELGQTNTLRAETMFFGGTGGSANVTFQSGLINPTLQIRSSDGTSAVGNLTIGYNSGDGAVGGANFNLNGGILDAEIVNLYVGRFETGSNLTQNSTLQFSAGTLNATTITLASKTGIGNQILNSEIIQTGGEVRASSLVFGEGGDDVRILGALYTLSGGNLTATTISAGSGSYHGTSSNRSLSISGNATLANTSGSNLVITGVSNIAGGLMKININGDATLLASNGDIVLSSNSSLTGSGSLTKNGSGNLTLSGTSSFTGATNINQGAVVLGANQTLGGITGSGNLSLGSYTLTTNSSSSTTFSGIVSGSGGLSKNGTGTITLSGNNTYSGVTTINAGTLKIDSTGRLGGGNYSANIVNRGSFIFGSDSDQVLSGIISGNGSLTKNGTGSLTLSGANTYNGTTTINAGSIILGSNQTLGGLSGSGNLSLSSYTLTSNAAANFNFSGVISGTGGLTKNGTGNLTLSGANSYTGTTTINAGSIILGSSQTLGVIAGAGNLSLSSYTLTTNSVSNFTFAGNISGSGGLTKNGTGNLTLSGANSYTGTTTINAGSIILGSNQTLGAIAGSGNLSLGSYTLTANSSASTNFSGMISGSGGLTKSGNGTLTLSANTAYTGATTINAGVLAIATTGQLGGGNYSANITNNGSLVFGSNSNQTLGGLISGTGGLTKNGSGTLTLGGNNNYSGNTTLNTGTLVIGNANAAGTGGIVQANGTSLLKFETTGTISNSMSVYNVLATQNATLSGAITVNNATFEVDAGDILTINGTISGSGGVTKAGNGTLTLSGSNSYTAATTINAGTLNAAHANALGANATVQVNGGSLLVSADDALSGKNIELSTNTIGLRFSGNYNGSIGNLTLSANSTLDLGTGSVIAMFSGINLAGYNLAIYNWTGETLWGGTNRNNTDQVYIMETIDSNDLNRISFYSSDYGSDSFLGTAFQLMDGGFANQVLPVPEPETWATGILLLVAFGFFAATKKRHGSA